MNILVVGSGGREHALIKALKKNQEIETIYALPGNGGMAKDAVCVLIGDVNGDGRVSVIDAILICRMSMNLLPLFNQHLADMNGDGNIGISDAIIALRISMML